MNFEWTAKIRANIEFNVGHNEIIEIKPTLLQYDTSG